MRTNSDVFENETVTSEDPENMDITSDEVLTDEESEMEESVVVDSYDYTPILNDIRGLLVLECVLLIAIGCIIAWTGARYE